MSTADFTSDDAKSVRSCLTQRLDRAIASDVAGCNRLVLNASVSSVCTPMRSVHVIKLVPTFYCQDT